MCVKIERICCDIFSEKYIRKNAREKDKEQSISIFLVCFLNQLHYIFNVVKRGHFALSSAIVRCESAKSHKLPSRRNIRKIRLTRFRLNPCDIVYPDIGNLRYPDSNRYYFVRGPLCLLELPFSMHLLKLRYDTEIYKIHVASKENMYFIQQICVSREKFQFIIIK